uniref:Putative nucleotidyltransferase n=2 Tax=viral metagenome TaxID=1070528 RepID=A0A6M3LGL0_9ZZZZ
MDNEKKVILKVLVGSHAHGLADETSDKDYRAVYVLPTSKILSLNYKYKGNDWVEGDEDNTAYEIEHFLNLAIRCNPSILEVFKAPIVEPLNADELTDGVLLRQLFPYVWNPNDAFNAFLRYGFNQRKKMLDNKDRRPHKFAVAYIRTLINLIDLLEHEDFSLEVDFMKEDLLRIKRGMYRKGEVIDITERLAIMAKDRLEKCKHEPNIEKVNKFLVDIRKRYW